MHHIRIAYTKHCIRAMRQGFEPLSIGQFLKLARNI